MGGVNPLTPTDRGRSYPPTFTGGKNNWEGGLTHTHRRLATCDQVPLYRRPNTVRHWRPPKSNLVITRSVAISAQTIVALSTATMKQRDTQPRD